MKTKPKTGLRAENARLQMQVDTQAETLMVLLDLLTPPKRLPGRGTRYATPAEASAARLRGRALWTRRDRRRKFLARLRMEGKA